MAKKKKKSTWLSPKKQAELEAKSKEQKKRINTLWIITIIAFTLGLAFIIVYGILKNS